MSKETAAKLVDRTHKARKARDEAGTDQNATAKALSQLEALTEEVDKAKLEPKEREAWVRTRLNGQPVPEAARQMTSLHGERIGVRDVEALVEAAEKKL